MCVICSHQSKRWTANYPKRSDGLFHLSHAACRWFALSCLFFLSSGNALHARYNRQEVEAAMLLKLIGFTEWKAGDHIPPRLGVYQDKEVFHVFEEMIADSHLKDSMEVVLINDTVTDETLNELTVIYIAEASGADVRILLKRVADRPILLASNREDFLELGGMVMLREKAGKMNFAINVGRAGKSGIEFRSRLLRLAWKVVDQ